jgi:hypothetical protein
MRTTSKSSGFITEPIADLDIKGTHLDRGYYYFRNIDNRIIRWRHLDFETENTTEFGQTEIVQKKN